MNTNTSLLAPGNTSVPNWGRWDLTRAFLRALDADSSGDRGERLITAVHWDSLDREREALGIPSAVLIREPLATRW